MKLILLIFFFLIKNADITENAAREHENWFVKFEELKARQKEAIIKWKNEKKNVIVNDCIPNISEVSKKSTDNDAKITLNVKSDYNNNY